MITQMTGCMADAVSLDPVQEVELDAWQFERRLVAVTELTRLIEQADNPAEAAAQVIDALEDMGWAAE
jgi:hypothetical protein